MAAEGWIASVDGGGTKTDVLFVNGTSRKGTLTSGGGTNPNVYGTDGIERLRNLLTASLAGRELSGENVEACVIGMAGVSHPKYRPRLEVVCADLLPNVPTHITSDAELAHRAIWGKLPGMTVLVGTGSIAVGEGADGILKRTGGFGFQTGDVGGGYWLGKSVLTELIAAERSQADEVLTLRDAVATHLGVGGFEMAVKMASADEGVSVVSGLAPLVLKHAVEGNGLAAQIVTSGAEGLQELVEELAEKIGAPSEIGLHGSVICESSFYRDLLLGKLGLDQWKRSEFPAVYGGLVIAEAVTGPEEFRKFAVHHG